MATNTYDEFRGAITAAGLGDLPRWSELDEGAREHAFRVLRRLGVARALDSGDAFSDIEVEAGLGEDAALQTFLLSTAVLIAAEGGAPQGKRDPIGAMLEQRLPAAALNALLQDCWVYRDDDLLAWTPLHTVRAGFNRQDDDDFRRLSAARKAWDDADLAEQLDWIGATVAALMRLYAHGTTQAGVAPRRIHADHEVRRELREAAQGERFSLLSDGAFAAAITGSVHQIDGVEVKVDAEEAYVRRSAFADADFAEWVADLAAWRPDGGEGETAFAWGEGLAMVVSGGSVAEWLRRCAEALLAGMIQEQRRAA